MRSRVLDKADGTLIDALLFASKPGARASAIDDKQETAPI
jgi:hypothetical protein